MSENIIPLKRVYLAIPSLDRYSFNKIIDKLKNSFFDVRYLPEKKISTY